MSKLIETDQTQREKLSGKFERAKDNVGKITSTLGTGDNAKNSLIYLTLKYTFLTGTIITILVVINYWLFRDKGKVPDFIGDVKIVWEIMIPVITLALGYAFGKSQK